MDDKGISPFERYGGYHPEADAAAVEHVFTASDTLSGLAHRYYKDWREWRRIADRNDITDARKIEPGTILIIPDLPSEEGQFESR